jgi:uncharacterized membrane protein YjdF
MLLRIAIGAVAVYWCVMAIAPHSRSARLLENVMTLVGIGALIAFGRKGWLSRFSILLATGFLVLHTTGAHYTYSLVPYDDWAQALFGQTISDVTGWQRNEFDRLVHFAFGVLLASGCHDVLVRSGRATSGTAWWVTLSPAGQITAATASAGRRGVVSCLPVRALQSNRWNLRSPTNRTSSGPSCGAFSPTNPQRAKCGA